MAATVGGQVLELLLNPVCWAMVSFGAWGGFLQFFTRPSLWEKTPTGFSPGAAGPPLRAKQATASGKGIWSAVVIVLVSATILGVSWMTLGWLDVFNLTRLAAISMNEAQAGQEIDVQGSWFGKATAATCGCTASHPELTTVTTAAKGQGP